MHHLLCDRSLLVGEEEDGVEVSVADVAYDGADEARGCDV